MKDRILSGSLSQEVTELELRHRGIARKIAAQGMVLLENDGVLPLTINSKVALYGTGARHTVKGGIGSGNVNSRNNVSVYEGLKNAGFEISNEEWLDEYDARCEAADKQREDFIFAALNGEQDTALFYKLSNETPRAEPDEVPITETDKSITAIYVLSRISGEGADRNAAKGDYFLTDLEEKQLCELSQKYGKLVVILNVGGVIDLSFMDRIPVSALLLMSQAGMEGGNALADVLTGKVNPSGGLTDSWAYRYEDYPSSANFSHNNGNLYAENYTEGIYVGYRYFDTFGVKTRYPFGRGLSYTSFELSPGGVSIKEDIVTVVINVKNTGKLAGQKKVLLFASCPRQARGNELKRLVSFGKTKMLQPGESEELKQSFDISLLSSWFAGKAEYIMPAGEYYLLAGDDAENVFAAGCIEVPADVVVETLPNICPLTESLKEINPDKAYAETVRAGYAAQIKAGGVDRLVVTSAAAPKKADPLLDAYEAKASELAAKLTIEEKANLVCGAPLRFEKPDEIGNSGLKVPGSAGETTSLLKKYGVESLVMCDGPAGLRVQQCYEEDPVSGAILRPTRWESLVHRAFGRLPMHEGTINHYQFCSGIPVGTLLAQSFDRETAYEAGDLVGREMEDLGVALWLAPGMNIHRNPLCGRNFEYYSEDPLVSGLIAAGVTDGVQRHPGCGVTIKHYACNNQEDNRRAVTSNVSERALREIYLKGFEIAVRKARPLSIMTSYNKINGTHTANSYDLCTEAARNEWGFDGIIMTDWGTTNENEGSLTTRCITAGNDLVMPGTPYDINEIILSAKGENEVRLTAEELDSCVIRMLKLIFAVTEASRK